MIHRLHEGKNPKTQLLISSFMFNALFTSITNRSLQAMNKSKFIYVCTIIINIKQRFKRGVSNWKVFLLK